MLKHQCGQSLGIAEPARVSYSLSTLGSFCTPLAGRLRAGLVCLVFPYACARCFWRQFYDSVEDISFSFLFFQVSFIFEVFLLVQAVFRRNEGLTLVPAWMWILAVNESWLALCVTQTHLFLWICMHYLEEISCLSKRWPEDSALPMSESLWVSLGSMETCVQPSSYVGGSYSVICVQSTQKFHG